ncbi:protein of unknown function [Candidatus Nitrosocosmicus franklandus]|uniref:Uncharacterized protein n=1 Tax=Candidatus Nitrosocosmicus franklandianus TaxID=1798806 RepID=A0A484I8K5_9ARCH|nr:protein of unknown function [Candidatus Nitrosocosmicus franklandus]
MFIKEFAIQQNIDKVQQLTEFSSKNPNLHPLKTILNDCCKLYCIMTCTIYLISLCEL